MDLINTLKSSTKGGKGKRAWVIAEILLMIKLKSEKYTDKQIGEVLGRSEYGVRYQLGHCRKFATNEDLFAAFNSKVLNADEINTIVEEFQDGLATNPPVSEEVA